MTMKMPGIYKITNMFTGDVYVGQSLNMYGRRECHFRKLFKGTHRNKRLQDDFSKYGSSAFEWKRLEPCQTEELCDREGYWKRTLSATYNQNEPPKQMDRSNARFNPTIQEIRRQQRQKHRSRKSTQS